MKRRQISLEFDSSLNHQFHETDLRLGLSAIAKTKNNLWLAPDDGPQIERLTAVAGKYKNHQSFKISDYIPFPPIKGRKVEFDLECLDATKDCIWFSASNSLHRDDPQETFPVPANYPERFVLGKIPLKYDRESGDYKPVRKYKKNRACALRISPKGNELTKALRKDKILKPFLKIPDKDNGLNIEGLAVHNKKIFLGLRAPVINGWAIILCIETKEKGGLLKLKKRGPDKQKFTKHFVHCNGLGIRDLKFDGQDLLIIAGPAMKADGVIKLYRWKNAAIVDKDSVVPKTSIHLVQDLPTVFKNEERDHAEGLLVLKRNKLREEILVVYDKPDPQRLRGENIYKADIFQIPTH